LLTNVGITVVPACMCRPIIEFSQAVYIIDPGFHLVLAGYQPAWETWYIALILSACMGNVVHSTYTTGTRALPDIYARALGPQYISGKALEPVV